MGSQKLREIYRHQRDEKRYQLCFHFFIDALFVNITLPMKFHGPKEKQNKDHGHKDLKGLDLMHGHFKASHLPLSLTRI